MSNTQRVESLPYFGKFDFRRAFAFGAAPGAVMIALAIGFATDPEASRAMSAYMPRAAASAEIQTAAIMPRKEPMLNQTIDSLGR